MNRRRTASRWLGGVAATFALVLSAAVTSPADADVESKDRISSLRKDTGWGPP